MSRKAPVNETPDVIDISEILARIPHRYPFLLVDRVIELVPNERVVAIKNVTMNEPFFQGHFPNHPVMPGVLVIEAMAQAAGTLIRLSADRDPDGKALFYLAKIDKARFAAKVVPGDQLRLEVRLKRMLRGMGLFEARALVDGNEVASCELMCAGRAE